MIVIAGSGLLGLLVDVIGARMGTWVGKECVRDFVIVTND